MLHRQEAFNVLEISLDLSCEPEARPTGGFAVPLSGWPRPPLRVRHDSEDGFRARGPTRHWHRDRPSPGLSRDSESEAGGPRGAGSGWCSAPAATVTETGLSAYWNACRPRRPAGHFPGGHVAALAGRARTSELRIGSAAGHMACGPSESGYPGAQASGTPLPGEGHRPSRILEVAVRGPCQPE